LFGQKRVPRFARLHGLVAFGQLRRAQGDGDQMIARGALNLFSGELFVRLQMLLAVWAGEFEFAHKLVVLMFIMTAPEAIALLPASFTPKPVAGLVKNR
jgi:hypothetical protein